MISSKYLRIVLGFYLLNATMALDINCADLPTGQLMKHPTDCHFYIVCSNDNPIETICPAEMHFDFAIQNCVAGECENYELTTEMDTTSADSTISDTWSTMEDSTSEDTPTTEDETTPSWETSTVEETTSKDATTVEEIETTEKSEDITTTDLPPETPTPNPEIEDGIECPRDRPNEIIFIPSEIDCERYYMCNMGNIYPLWCREGLHFNRETYKCDYPELANCTLEIDGGEVDEDGIPLCSDTVYSYYLAHPHKCNYFIYCLAGNRYISSCPLYKSWDYYLKQCVDSSVARCAPGAQ